MKDVPSYIVRNLTLDCYIGPNIYRSFASYLETLNLLKCFWPTTSEWISSNIFIDSLSIFYIFIHLF